MISASQNRQQRLLFQSKNLTVRSNGPVCSTVGAWFLLHVQSRGEIMLKLFLSSCSLAGRVVSQMLPPNICAAAPWYSRQAPRAAPDARGGTRSFSCQKGRRRACWSQVASVCLRAGSAFFHSSRAKDASERCFLQLLVAFSKILLWG